MMNKVKQLAINFFYWLPIRLLFHHIKNNQVLLLLWIVLFMIVTGNFGKLLGMPYLFLDPEYLNKVDFMSFLWIGATLAGFTTAYHITSYIIDGHRFTFIGTITKPFTTFSINNNIIPIVFFIVYTVHIVKYQFYNKGIAASEVAMLLFGLFVGYIIMSTAFYVYFLFTNKNIFKYVICKVDEKLKHSLPLTRVGAMKKLNIAKREQVRVDYYTKPSLKIAKVTKDKGFYDRATILQVFDQNHFNLVIIEFLIFILLLVLGLFRHNAYFQIPAAASLFLFFTMLLMFAGAFSYWFGRWSITVFIIILLALNVMSRNNMFSREYQVYGLDYEIERVDYTLSAIKKSNNEENIQLDIENTLNILNNWKANYMGQGKPKMVLTCASGGGQRAALWTLTVLQRADSITNGKLMKHTSLMTGASGGMIGASYFRELILRENTDSLSVSPYDFSHTRNIAKDNLNAIVFSLLVNDFFIGGIKHDYLGFSYLKDRGYAFEKQLDMNTAGLLNKSIAEYKMPEYEAKIPLLIMAPTIMNDGRKLFISAQNVSYMAADPIYENWYGIDFSRFFYRQGSGNLSFYSALRMNAAFPFITPNLSLPSSPPIEIMDAGIADNFGINDAVRFLYVFNNWISENTSGVLILSIRDSKKEFHINQNRGVSILEMFTTPISGIYSNFENLQNINNDSQIQHARSWFKGDLEHLIIEYDPELNLKTTDRASLNWRLTEKEKNSVLENVDSKINKDKMRKLKLFLN
ncbi:MAG: patatin-like phospholipase family protein [Cyclobacteriaceae bacterium]|nr:patatin-like phospholipase family protein [Cyclobacteriaceae bacterium]